MIPDRKYLENIADRCELEMIVHAERSLKAEPGPVKTNSRTAAAEMAMVAGTLRDRIARLYPAAQVNVVVGAPDATGTNGRRLPRNPREAAEQ